MALDALSSTSPADIWSLSALDNTRIWDSDMIRTRLYLVVLLYDVGHLELIFVGHLDSEGRRALDRDISKANRWHIAKCLLYRRIAPNKNDQISISSMIQT